MANEPIGNVDRFGLDAISPFNPPCSFDSYLPVDPGPTPGVGSIEAHFVVGVGVSAVTFCGADNYYHKIYFVKVCFGPNAGGALGMGAIISGIPDCPTVDEVIEKYSGWFLEIGGSLGPLGAGVDLGVDEGRTCAVNRFDDVVKRMNTCVGLAPCCSSGSGVRFNGVCEVLGNCSVGLEGGATMCRYFPLPCDDVGPRCCCRDK